MKRVLIATGLYPPDIGGPATYTKFLERHLPHNGVELTVVAFTHVRKYPKIIRHGLYIFRVFQASRGVDVIYALDPISVGVPALLVAKITRKKFFLRVPGDYAWEQGQHRFGVTDTLDEYLARSNRPLPVRVLAWIQSRVARSATRVIVPSEYMKTVVAAWGVAPERVTRIYSALNPIAVSGSKSELRQKYRYDGFVITTAARLTPWKGITALVSVTKVLHDEGIPVSLYILGDGEERKKLEAQVRELDATSYVHLEGQVTKDILAERIKASDVFALNTSYEGLSHQLLEVMEIGTPIVTTAVGGNVELITHEKEGLIVSWNNEGEIHEALKRVRDGGGLIEHMVVRAREKASLFREDCIIPEIVALFR